MRSNRIRNVMAVWLLGITAWVSLQTVLAQTQYLVWSDEFNGTAIDTSVWSFGAGATNDNVHYYTARSENARLVSGELQIIARKESYMGYDYTSALLQTKNAVSWRRGRVEARIKLPGGAGFVPAFWMMPADDMYGWWPCSGEIDIMEHPTTQPSAIYGTAHARAYSSFMGTAPKSTSIQIPDAETAFHVYAVEWSAEQIDYYVDTTKYFTVTNDHGGPPSWPFDQPFYIILDLAVGGGWVGNPAPTTVFPALMEVDYVRVYQLLDDMLISGKDFVLPMSSGVPYAVPLVPGAAYSWSIPPTSQITAGQSTHQISINWGNTGGNVGVTAVMTGASATFTYPVVVSNNLLRNGGFEKGVKYWNNGVAYPAKASMDLDSAALVPGNHWAKAVVTTAGANPWDVQITQQGFAVKSGTQYEGRFKAKADVSGKSISVSLINAKTFNYYGGMTVMLSDAWKAYTFRVTPTENAGGSFNVDFGLQAGMYAIDSISLVDPTVQSSGGTHDGERVPGLFSVGQNYPNPFNPVSTIGFAIAESRFVTLKVYDLLGREVAVLVNEQKVPGRYEVKFDASALASGVYLYRIQAGTFAETKKLVVVR
jgi:beta-glucanase (GH16 family)